VGHELEISMSEREIAHVRKFLAQRIRQLRKQQGLTQQGLAERSGLSERYICYVERSQKSISIDSLYRISVALKVPLRLLTTVGTSRESVPSEDAERILAFVLDGHRPASIRRAYEVLQRMLDEAGTSRASGRRTLRAIS
jgi:transcriptional regulator with XRE-family HTH domain